jgi:hypothetical protein
MLNSINAMTKQTPAEPTDLTEGPTYLTTEPSCDLSNLNFAINKLIYILFTHLWAN